MMMQKKIDFLLLIPQHLKLLLREDPNWGRIIMAIGKAMSINVENLSINFGNLNIINDGKINPNYNEEAVTEYIRNDNIDLNIDIANGTKNFTVYTMDFTKKYIDINADYRS